mmetsp:Transcript_14419/g.29924  ORF Transcript_14419/g.29924 Transcript_14419/m.29924 type:complete len:213 (-) Transcript_14419:244-882(-)
MVYEKPSSAAASCSACSPAAFASRTPHAFRIGKGIVSRRVTPMELNMMARFRFTLAASFHASKTSLFARLSTFFGVFRPFLSNWPRAWDMSNFESKSAEITSDVIENSPDRDHASVGKAVVPVQITIALASRSAGRRDSGQDVLSLVSSVDCTSSKRSVSNNEILSSRPSKKDLTDLASLTIPFTLYVSERRSATSFPTFPDAPTTATVSPG